MAFRGGLAVLLALMSVEGRAEPSVTVSGQVQVTGAHCGGAMMTPGQMAAIAAPQPDPGRRVLVRLGSENTNTAVLVEIVADRQGKFSVSLTPGTYCVVRETKRKVAPMQPPAPNAHEIVDGACLEREAKTCDAVWTVTAAGLEHANVTFPTYCPWSRPCVQYSGPLPPAAAHRPASPSPH